MMQAKATKVFATQNSARYRVYHAPTHLPTGRAAERIRRLIFAIKEVKECVVTASDVHVFLHDDYAWNAYCDRRSGNIVVDDDPVHCKVMRLIANVYRGAIKVEGVTIFRYDLEYYDQPRRLDAAA